MIKFKQLVSCVIFLILAIYLSNAQTIKFSESERPIIEILNRKNPKDLNPQQLNNLNSKVEKLINSKNKELNHYLIYLNYLKWRSRVEGYTKSLTARAINACEQWLAYKPDDINFIYKLGLLQELNGNLSAAKKAYQRVNESLNKHPLDVNKKLSDKEINDFIAAAGIYLGINKNEKALTIISSLSNKYPNNKNIQAVKKDFEQEIKTNNRNELILRML